MKLDSKEQVRAAYSVSDSIGFNYTESELGKTMIKHINQDFESGVCLLVGEKRSNGKKVKIDTVNLSIARAITGRDGNGGRFQFLDKASIKPHENVYLAAHGFFRTRTIDKRSLSEIAELLVKAGFDGTQHIISFACDSDRSGIDIRSSILGGKDPHKTMREELQAEIKKELDKRGKTTAKSSIHISDYANGKTILLNRAKDESVSKDSTNGDLWIINPVERNQTENALMAQRALMYWGDHYKIVDLGKYKEGEEIELDTFLSCGMKAKVDSADRFKFALVDGFLDGNNRAVWGAGYDPHVMLNTVEMALTLAGIIIGGSWMVTGMPGCESNKGTFGVLSVVMLSLLLMLDLIRTSVGTKSVGEFISKYADNDSKVLIGLAIGLAVGLKICSPEACEAFVKVCEPTYIGVLPSILLIYSLYKYIKNIFVMFK